ncbi:MAG: hypothetical protein HKN12_02425, partial [Gemmatimonadetes bacterium]|nr:hypothetical protein [Gemmatimonadota bacterium]
MATTTETRETLSLTPPAGCGTLESPWTGWEATLEETAAADTRVVNLAPGFYGVSRPVRLGAGILVRKDPAAPGQAWILPAASESLETLFLV